MNSIPFDFSERIVADSRTHPGKVRPHNEDAVGFFPEEGCFFVADGMGGGAAGDVASSFLENELSDAIEQTGSASSDQREADIRNAIHRTHMKIRDYAESKQFDQMGTTLALMMLNPPDAHAASICHIGDSRIYLLRDGALTALTMDHTVGAELERENKSMMKNTDWTDHRTSRFSHILTRVIGGEDEPEAEWNEIAVRPFDRFLICSDGVTTMLQESVISDILSASDHPSDAVRRISDAVLDAGARDNFSMVVVFVREDNPEKK